MANDLFRQATLARTYIDLFLSYRQVMDLKMAIRILKGALKNEV